MQGSVDGRYEPGVYVFEVKRDGYSFYGEPMRKGDTVEVRSGDGDKLARAFALHENWIMRFKERLPLDKVPRVQTAAASVGETA